MSIVGCNKHRLQILLETLWVWYAFHIFAGTMLIHGAAFVELCVVVLFLLTEIIISKYEWNKQYKSCFLPILFACCLAVGNSYVQAQSGGDWLGLGNPVRMCLVILGEAILIRKLLILFEVAWKKIQEKEVSLLIVQKWKEHCFRNTFVALLVLWLPILILSYPGNLAPDSIWQLKQGLGEYPLYGHHPLLPTVFMGGIVKLGYIITGTYDVGLFVYALLQAVFLAAVLAWALSWLTQRGCSDGMFLVILAIYILSPMYSNAATTILKDVPYVALVVIYTILLVELYNDRQKIRDYHFLIKMASVALLLSLFRHNGVFIIGFTGVGLLLGWWKQTSLKEKMLLALGVMIVPLFMLEVTNSAMASIFQAETLGSKGEILSLPFQQTARYLTVYKDELSEEEFEVYNTVFKDVDLVIENYNPDIADPVKALYQDVMWGDLFKYAECYVKGFLKHPGVYFDAFFAHIYGWFDPGVRNAIRYSTDMESFHKTELIQGADEFLVQLYERLDEIPFLSILQNVGIYTWLLFILGRKICMQNKKQVIILIPCFVSLLICMVSPCFYNHPRYAWPIMFTIPFLYGVVSLSKLTEGTDER